MAPPAPPTTPPPAPPRSMPPPPRSAPASTAPTSPNVAGRPRIQRLEAKVEPPRVVLNAVEGWGKTTIAAFAPEPLIVMARGETGFRTLVNQGRAPARDAVSIESWTDLLAILDDLIAQASLPYRTIAFDAMGGFERLCHEHVCTRDFKGDFGEKGFGSFQKGFDVSVGDWLQLLSRLDRLHARGIGMILLSHARIRPFKNPLGSDFDRYVSDVHEKTWSATAKWADAVLFGSFVTIVDKEKQGKGKGIGGTDRVLYTERRDGFDAKNRYGMPESIDIPADPTQSWATVAQYFGPVA